MLNGFGSPRAGGMIHGGIDLEVPRGGDIKAVCAGQVASSGSNDTYGEHVELDCGDGWTAIIAYLGSRAVPAGDIASFASVIGRADTQLGYVHIEIRWGGVPVDPAAYVPLGPLPVATTSSTASPTPAGTVTPSPTATVTATTAAGLPASPASTPTVPARATPVPTTESAPSATPNATPVPTRTPTATPVPPTPANTAPPTLIPPPTPTRTPTPRPVFE